MAQIAVYGCVGICALCGTKIDGVGQVPYKQDQSGKKYHVNCPKCSKCHNVLSGQCYDTLSGKLCMKCGKETNDGYTVPLSHASKYIGNVVRDGECASGVQQIFKDYHGKWILKTTSTWKQGKKVFHSNIKSGTAIASFKNGRYTGKGCHTAIYVSQDNNGITVYDQWKGKKFGKRVLKKSYSDNSPNSNHPDYFYVIKH